MPTPNLSLPWLEAGQAQKHVTLNESLRRLDAIVQLAVAAVSASPPGEPGEGERHIVGGSATGAFDGHAGEIAAFQDGGWMFLAPQPGWRAWNLDEEKLLVWSGSAWTEISAGGGGEGDVVGPEGGVADGDVVLFDGTTGKAIRKGRGAIDYLGVGAAPDGTDTDTSNRLTVRGNRALFHAIPAAETPGSGDMKVQVSKEAAGNAASWFFATNFDPRGEIGFIGDDDELRFKVFDGANWHEGLSIVRANGAVKVRGVITAPADLGTIDSGTVTPDPQADRMFEYVNDGAHTLAPSANPGSYVLDIENDSSAGAIATGGWDFVTGDAFDTTNGSLFRCFCTIGASFSTLEILKAA